MENARKRAREKKSNDEQQQKLLIFRPDFLVHDFKSFG